MHFLRYATAALLLALLALPAQAQLVRSAAVSEALAEATMLSPSDAPASTSTPIVQVAGGLEPTNAYGDYNFGGGEGAFGFWTADDLQIQALGPQPTTEEGDPLTISSTFGPDNVLYSIILLDDTYFLAFSDALDSENGYEIIAEVGVDAGRFGNPVGIQYDAISGTAVIFTLGCGTVEIDGEDVYVQSYVHTIDLESGETGLITELADPAADGETNFGVCVIGVSWDPIANIVFASDIVSDDIVKVDVTTGEFIERDTYAFDNPILEDVAFIQDAAWDPNTQVHYVMPFSVDRNDDDEVTAIASPMYVCESAGGCEYIGDLENEGSWVEPLGTAFADLTNVAAEDDGVARGFEVLEAYPNPATSEAYLDYQLDAAGFVQVDVYNVLGQHVRTVARGTQAAGAQQAVIGTAGLPAGLYLVRVQTEQGVATRSLTVMD